MCLHPRHYWHPPLAREGQDTHIYRRVVNVGLFLVIYCLCVCKKEQIGHKQQQMGTTVPVLWSSSLPLRHTYTVSLSLFHYLSLSLGYNLEGRSAVIACFCPFSTADLLFIAAVNTPSRESIHVFVCVLCFSSWSGYCLSHTHTKYGDRKMYPEMLRLGKHTHKHYLTLIHAKLLFFLVCLFFVFHFRFSSTHTVVMLSAGLGVAGISTKPSAVHSVRT